MDTSKWRIIANDLCDVYNKYLGDRPKIYKEAMRDFLETKIGNNKKKGETKK